MFLIYLYSFQNIKGLIDHMNLSHNKDIIIHEKNFASLSKFLSWKEEDEQRNNASYVRQCGPQVASSRNVKRHYYYCNRSGQYTAKGSGSRQLKVQGSCKVGDVCTAHLKAIEDLSTGSVHLEYCTYHHNHKEELAHLRMPDELRKKIAVKLQEGVAEKKILDDIRDTVSIDGEIKHDHFVSLKDIHNIQTQYNIEGIQRHANDHSSVKIWVEEMKSQPYNPILLYKPQGELENGSNLGLEDFLLCIQTEFQRDVMKQFGNNIICMDATHSITVYDFLLISVLVVDEYCGGVPVAWAISNREDSVALKEFLGAVKSEVGDLHPHVFMSDCASQHYNAWIETFKVEDPPQKLLCTWHVDKAWRKKLHEAVPDKEQRIKNYHHLRVLLEERNMSSFYTILQQFLSMLSKEAPSFKEYFSKEYVPHKKEWLYAYRAGSGINTNMYSESFHHLLKVVYLNSKQNRRVDHILSVLLQISKDKAFERMCKLEGKCKSSHRLCKINKHHKSAMELISKGVSPQELSKIHGMFHLHLVKIFILFNETRNNVHVALSVHFVVLVSTC